MRHHIWYNRVCDAICFSELLDDIESAFKDGESCVRNAPLQEFPDCEFRWFLTREFQATLLGDTRPETHLIFIGMNPAEAQRFAGKHECGDWTCAYLVNRRENHDYPECFGEPTRLSFVNLVPVVATKPSEAKKKWDALSNYHEEILKLNAETLKMILSTQEDFYVIPVFGTGLKSPGDWRWNGFTTMLPILEELKEAELRIFAIQKDSSFAPHPRQWPKASIIRNCFEPALEQLQKLRNDAELKRQQSA